MKTEVDYINDLKERWPKDWQDPEPTKETISIVDAAVKCHPNSEKLWIMRGDLYLLINYEDETPIGESLYCYEKAIEINPRSHEAYFEKATFIDLHLGKPRKAKQYYEKARRLKNA